MNKIIKSIDGEMYEISSTTQRHNVCKEKGCESCHDRCEFGFHIMGLYAHEYEVK